jgi:peptide/nickel transport system permease protein
MGIKENAYIMAADSIGCSTSRVVFRHIVHNIMAVLIILYTANMPGIILAEASLSFLGFGLPPPQPSWGVMLSGSGRRYMFLQPGMAIWPGFALALVVFGINVFGDAIRDILDPRLRGSVGRYSGVKVKKQRY